MIQDEIKTQLEKLIKDEFNVDSEVEIMKTSDSTHGDFSTNIAMKLAKQLGKAPIEIAKEIADKFSKESNNISSVEAVTPGFINFKIASVYFSNVVKQINDDPENYGKGNTFQNKTILIEHTSPNPNKEMHLGHLKNNFTGLSISYLFEAMGAKVYRDCINNNRGIAIAKLMWGYLKYGRKNDDTPIEIDYWFDHQDEWKTPESEGKEPGKFMDEFYTKGAADAKENEEVDKAVRQLVLDWEADEPKNHALWKQTQTWVWEGYRKILERIGGWKFDKIWNESDIYRKGKEHVEKGLALGVFKRLPDGAVITDLKKEFNLSDTILIKNDGTSLYITQDLELTRLKKETFNPDEMFWVIGPEQSLAMKQMFAVCSQLGWGKYSDFHHIAYGFILVKDKDGKASKMSSRAGTQLYVSDLVDMAKNAIAKLMQNRELTKEEIDEISEKVGIAAIKYSLLKVNRLQDMVFDFETSVSLEGDSAPYLMYTYTRAKSILRQANVTNVSSADYQDEHELELVKKLYVFPDKIIEAGTTYMPNIIANYLYELALSFNKFYTNCPVLNAKNETQKASRLQLVSAFATVMKNGLAILGIQTVEKM